MITTTHPCPCCGTALQRWLELVHSAVLLLDEPLSAARGLVLWLLAAGSFALGWLVCWILS